MSGPADRVPSVFNTFRIQRNHYYPIIHTKTPQLIKAPSQLVTFPAGHATFPPEATQTIIFSQAIQSFTKLLQEALQPTEQPTETPQPQTQKTTITPQIAEKLTQAFEGLQASLVEVAKALPQGQPLPKALSQLLVQTPGFIQEFQKILQAAQPFQPILEEAEVPFKLPIKELPPELAEKLKQQIEQNIPAFIKTLQSALAQLPPALPPAVKEDLEKYLQEFTPIAKNVAPEQPPVAPKIQQQALVEKPPILEYFRPLLERILQTPLPFLEDLFALLHKHPILPKQILQELEQIPYFFEELRKLMSKKGTLEAPEFFEKNLPLIEQLPNLVEALKKALERPNISIPKELQTLLEQFVKTFPQEELAFLLSHARRRGAPSLAESMESPKAPTPTEVQNVPLGVVSPMELFEGVQKEVFKEVEKVYPNRGEAARGGQNIEKEGPPLHALPPPLILTQIAAKEMIQRQPEISTEIPFAFIVPYVPNSPIHNVASEAEIPEIDPWKEIVKDEGPPPERKSLQLLAYIPKGEVWMGESPYEKKELPSYAIGLYLVTNQQYADFLSKQSRLQNIHVGDQGKIYSKDQQLLCQVKQGTMASDIEMEPGKESFIFHCSNGKESHPVTCVTYFGAKAFCRATGFRLPTEEEWEKAASNKVDENNQVQMKYRFGCSSDTISKALANYETKVLQSKDIFTTPVGFYNGKNTFMKEGVLIETQDAKSPWGCYDMSGNVWEWTETGQEDVKVLKGGSYISSEEEVTSFSRKLQETAILDGYTGFRIALS